jgi:hypothetical protein
MANDPVLQRSMFQKQAPTVPSVAPSVGLGIGSVTTPDQNAQAMRSLFQPTVSMSMPMQEPVQSFQEGGLAKSLIAQYDWRNQRYQNPPSYLERTDPEAFAAEEARKLATARARSFDIDDAEARSPKPQDRTILDRPTIEMGRDTSVRPQAPGLPGLVQSEARRRALEQLSQIPAGPPRETAEPEIRREYREEVRKAAIPAPPVPPAAPSVAALLERDRADEPRMPTSAAERQTVEAPPAAAEAPARQKGTLELTLDGIKAERAADRRENALLALMQAGFAMAAGRSPNALSNIGAGGQAGIGAFAAMERASREDAASRRREAIQLDLANRQLEKDPEAVRTYAILGGYKPGDPRESYSAAVAKGFNATQSKEGPKLAAAIINNPMSSQFYSQQELKDLADYARRGIIGMGAAGKEAFPGFSGTVVTPPAK